MRVMSVYIVLGFIWLCPLILMAQTPPVSNTNVPLEGDAKLKYLSLLIKMDRLAYSGKTALYANLTEERAARLGSIDSAKRYREIVQVPDTRYTGNFKDSVLEIEKPLDEWCNGVVFTVEWNNGSIDQLKGEIVGFGLTYGLNIAGQDLGTYPMFYFKMSALEHFTESEKEQLKELLAINYHSFTSVTRLYAKTDSRPQHPDSMLDFSSFKTRPFFDANKLCFDKGLKKNIEDYFDFERLVRTTDTVGLQWDSKYMWRYPRWLFTSHLEYYTEVQQNDTDWSLTLFWRSIGISSHSRDKNGKTFFMSVEAFRKQVTLGQWEQVEKDYLEAVMLGFEHPTYEP